MKKYSSCILGILLILVCIMNVVLLTRFSGMNEPKADFYDKLHNQKDVNILIVGDSISEGACIENKADKWTYRLKDWIEAEYDVKCNMTNISMGGNTSYAGYGRVIALDDGVQYDLAIICYGQNDSLDHFRENYESIILALEEKYTGIDMISILESAQLTYTEKMDTIQELCDYYGIPVADTIAGFAESGYAYDALTDDGTHPNEKGAGVYFTVLSDVIQGELNKEITGEWVFDSESARFYAAEECKRVDDCTWKIKCGELEGRIGIYRYFAPGDYKIVVKIDDGQEIVEEGSWEYDFKQAHFYEVSGETYHIDDYISVIFESKERADDFMGVMVSDTYKSGN